MCESLLLCNEDGGPTHGEKIDALHRRFPKVRRWIDWWTTADIEAMLFPSRRQMLDDSPNTDDGLPDTTNAQESMHRVYYMLRSVGLNSYTYNSIITKTTVEFCYSTGKKSLMIGMIELYAFVMALEKDWVKVQRGVPIAYGSLPAKQVNISQSVGWNKATKRQKAAWNDGRAPDTTEQLLAGSEQPMKRAKLGRPKNSPNVNKDPQSTYVSYRASTSTLARNRCWLAAALELLYAVYSPLWLQEPGGKQTDLFFVLVSHFTTRSTYEMCKSPQIRSILTRGSNKIFIETQKLYPLNFISGAFSSCDLFLELVLDVKKNKSKTLPKLFCVQENRSFTCPLHPGQQQHPRGSRQLGFLNITKSMFESNAIDCTNAAELINRWATGGLDGTSGLQCSACNSKPSSNYLLERSTISIINGAPPAHLHFHVNVVLLSKEDEQIQFMGAIHWPFKLSFAGEEYTLISRGFWGKILRQINGVTAVWMHDDRSNAGIAQLVDQVPGSISGAQPHTSWLIYSRRWTSDESAFIN